MQMQCSYCLFFNLTDQHFQHVNKMGCGGEDEESGADDDFEIDDIDDSLYRAALGTRPELPSDLELDEEDYAQVLSVFYASTEMDPDKRPSAEAVLRSLDESSKESAPTKSKNEEM